MLVSAEVRSGGKRRGRGWFRFEQVVVGYDKFLQIEKTKLFLREKVESFRLMFTVYAPGRNSLKNLHTFSRQSYLNVGY